MPAPTLLTWLRSLDPDELALCLQLRADVLWGAPVTDLVDLADRLQHPGSVTHAVVHLSAPWIELLEALLALGDRASVDAAADLLAGDGPPDEHRADVQAAVEGLVGAALVVPGPDGRLAVNPGVRAVILAPLALAPPARSLLDDVSAAELHKVTRRWGLDVARRKADLVDAVAEHLADPGHVRRLVGGAPQPVAGVLLEQVQRAVDRARSVVTTVPADVAELDPLAALHGPQAFRRYRDAAAWALENGLAYGAAYDPVAAVIPSEVLLALAPPGFRLRWQPEPPHVPTAPVAARQVSGAAGAAVTELLGTAMAVLDLAARRPLAVLKSGGVGAREIQRVANAVGATPDDVRLVLECTAHLGLLEVTADRAVPSDDVADWRTGTPAQRAGTLLQSWLSLPTLATADRDADGRSRPALAPLDAVREPRSIRVMLLARAHDLEDGVGVASVDALADWVRWRLPLAASPWSPEYVTRSWAEAGRLGVVAAGACTDLGRALLGGDTDRLEAVLDGVLPAVRSTALIGSDLTVVVPGIPDAAVVDLLDAVATRESRGAASTWRLTPASVRQALDAGDTAEGVLAALEAIGGRLPQALEYLVRDVGRRHGHLRVGTAAAVLTSDDVALVAEVAAHRSLRRLRLRTVAPTVVVAQSSVADVLAALRGEGYLPVEVSDDGTPVIELRRPAAVAGDAAAHPRGTGSATDAEASEDAFAVLRRWGREQRAARRGGPAPPAPGREDAGDAAGRLVRGLEPVPAAGVTDVERRLRDNGLRLSAAEVRQLAFAIVHERPVSIRYRSSSGGVTVRVVSELEVSGGSLFAWCHLRDDQRFFSLARVLAVSAVPQVG